MPSRWRGLGNGSTPVSHHITTRLRKVNENVDPAKLGGYARLSLTRGLGCPDGVGPGLGVGPAGLLVRALGKCGRRHWRRPCITTSRVALGHVLHRAQTLCNVTLS